MTPLHGYPASSQGGYSSGSVAGIVPPLVLPPGGGSYSHSGREGECSKQPRWRLSSNKMASYQPMLFLAWTYSHFKNLSPRGQTLF